MALCYRAGCWVKPCSPAFLSLCTSFRGEFDAVGVMDEAVEDGVGVGWVADDVVPSVDGR